MKYLLLVILFISANVFAQSDKKSQDILNKISAEINGLNSFYIEFNMYSKNPITGENSNLSGTGYVKDKKYYASLGETTILSNGIKAWTILKSDKMTYMSDVDDDDEETLSPKKLMTIWENNFKSKYDQQTKVDNIDMHEISLFPIKPGEVNYHTIILYITVDGNQLHRAIMKTKDGGVTTYTIKKFNKNASVADSKFVYNPKDYPGYELVRD